MDNGRILVAKYTLTLAVDNVHKRACLTDLFGENFEFPNPNNHFIFYMKTWPKIQRDFLLHTNGLDAITNIGTSSPVISN